ncbi:IclR family transcriptional regulator [uncultured Tateyamaria sp.]|uniref:IclR family transcriptional regulator n=1 Tax=uncultured Tateyamaria sp. TaxID=455651 RepID=UPI0026043F76|nr:IclR family transcriptional regulator [uncultured Tateyamaria sp.]
MSTVAKALGLLDLFSDTQPRLGLSDVQRLTGRDKATVHRHLSALEQMGFLEQDPISRAYRLGPAVTRLAAMRARTVPEVEMVRAVVDAVSRAAGELVHLSRVRGFDLVDIYHAEHHDHPVRVSFDAYGLPPLLATSSGKAYLAFSAPDIRERALADPRTRLASAPAPDADVLAAEMDEIAARGYACNRDQLRAGVSSVAIPVFQAQGAVFATCSIAYPTSRGGAEVEARLAHLLVQHGTDITHAMGGHVPPAVQTIWTQTYERTAP